MTLFRAYLPRALACLSLATLAGAQVIDTDRRAIIAINFDLDGEAADDDQVVTAANGTITDSTSYTITASPDVCRLLDVTVTDADSSISAGTLTVVGTDCWNRALQATFSLAGGSGVRTGTVTAVDSANPVLASGAYFKTVTTVSNGAVTGEGVGDTIKVGYTSNSAKSWPLYGRQSQRPDGTRFVDTFGKYDVPQLVKNGAATTDIVAVSASTTAPFENVVVGDLLIFNISGQIIVRKVATRADADTITVSPGVTLPSAGVNFSFKRFYFLADPIDGWISVYGYGVFGVVVNVAANADTGGVTTVIECTSAYTDSRPDLGAVQQVDTQNVATGAASTTYSTSVVLREVPHFTHCRAGIKFGTGDDTDTANEDISATIALSK